MDRVYTHSAGRMSIDLPIVPALDWWSTTRRRRGTRVGMMATAVTVMVLGLLQSPVLAGADAPTSPEGWLLALLREGGAWAVLAVVLYQYRRDWNRLADQTQPLINIATQAAQAQMQMAVAMAQNTEVQREILREIKDLRESSR